MESDASSLHSGNGKIGNWKEGWGVSVERRQRCGVRVLYVQREQTFMSDFFFISVVFLIDYSQSFTFVYTLGIFTVALHLVVSFMFLILSISLILRLSVRVSKLKLPRLGNLYG